MKFHTLEVCNFLTIRGAHLKLADRGLQLIQGANNDDTSASSNGSGKSSIVDAIAWVLFGMTAREVKGDAVVNRLAKKDCKVILTLTSGGCQYRVTRHRKHTVGKNTLTLELLGDFEADAIDMSKGTDAETQEVLIGLIGCSHEVFMAAVYCGQEAMPDLPRKKDRELKMLIEEAAGMQRIEAAYGVAKANALTERQTLDLRQNNLSQLRVEQASRQVSLLDTRDKSAQWALAREVRIEDSRLALVTSQLFLAGVKEEIRMGESSASIAGARIREIDEMLASHKSGSNAAEKKEKDARAQEMKIDRGGLVRISEAIKAEEARIANAESEVRKPCSECGTILETMSVEDFVAHRTGHLLALKGKLDDAKAEARRQIAELAVLRKTAEEARALVPDVGALVSERKPLEEAIKKRDELLGLAERATSGEKMARERLALRTSETDPLMTLILSMERSAAEIDKTVADAELKVKQSEKLVEVTTAVARVFGPAGVRAQILDTVTPLLNEATSAYLGALSDGEITATWTTLSMSAGGELKEKFSIDVTHAKGADSFAGLSGGEKRKVRLACALALQDLVASRATQPIDFLAMDEIDDALDGAGLERLMVLLERKARDRGTVLLISHNSLADWCDQVTTVTKEDGQSTVAGALCE